MKTLLFFGSGRSLCQTGTIALFPFLLISTLLAGSEKNSEGKVQAGQVLQNFREISSAPSSDIYRIRGALQAVINSTSDTQQKAFLLELLPQALDLMWEKKIPLSATISMAIYESDYGRSGLARVHKNYFGIKAFNDWSGPKAVNMPTRDGGINTRADFRSYSSLSESTRNYGTFLSTKKHYQSAFTAADGPEFVQKVLAGGYCPDPDYHSNITNLIRKHKLLELEQACQTAFAGGTTSDYEGY